jgi:hypothetical protein
VKGRTSNSPNRDHADGSVLAHEWNRQKSVVAYAPLHLQTERVFVFGHRSEVVQVNRGAVDDRFGRQRVRD